MQCPRCRQDTPPDAQFCPECGSRLAVTCAQCGTANAPGHKFCKSCGRPLVPAPESGVTRFESPHTYTPKHLAERILTSKSALEGERKQVTVLFCDIANSTTLAERLGAEAMHDLLDKFFELALTEVHRFEGTVNQFLGDGFMALFGAPLAHEDDARRAVLAAWGIDRRLRERRAELAGFQGGPLMVRMGLNTGLVVVGKIGDNLRMDYTAVGDTTNLAARLQQAAEPGTILLSTATHRLVEGAVRAEEVAGVSVKGRSEPIVAYRLLGVGARRSPLEERPTRTLGRFVGRQRELGMLHELFAQMMAGQGQFVGLVGEPGMGKSRVLFEFRQGLAGKPITFLEGRCVSYGGSIPYLPWLDVLRHNCGIVDGDAPDAIAGKIAHGLREVGMTPEEWGMYLLHLFGVKEGTEPLDALSPEAVKARTFETLRQMSLKGSGRRPLVLAIEDAHWVDKTSEEYLAFLVESLTATRILVLATYRPGYRPPWMDRSYATQIALRPLARQDSLAVVQSALPSEPMPGELADTILGKAEGNPFFLEELALALAEHRGPEHVIPDTVQGVLAARIDRLSDGAKRLIRTASVLGREFPLKLLERLWDDEGPLHSHLLELKRLEFVYERAGGEDPVYVFKHALTQDVAYDGLLTQRRRALHAAAGRALEEFYVDRLDEVDGALAHHYARSDIPDKAVAYLMRVADKAARVYANVEALAHLREALAHLARLPADHGREQLLIDITLRQGFSLYFVGRFEESVELLIKERDALERLGDPSRSGPYYFWLAHMYSRLGRQELATQSAQRAIAEATRCGDDATLGKAHGLLALEGHWTGTARAGIEHARQAVASLERTPQQWWLGMAHFYMAMNQLLTGGFPETLAAAERARAIGEAIGDARLQCYAAFVTGWVAAMRGELAIAVEDCQRSRKLSPDRVSGVYAEGFLGYTHVERGDPESAIPLLEHTTRELEQFGFPQFHGMFTSALAEACRLAGDSGRALDLARRGLDISRSARYWLGVGYAERVLGRIAWNRGAADEAVARLTDALQTFTSIEAQFEVGRLHLELATLARAGRDREGARRHLAAADAALRDLEAPVYHERVRLLAAEHSSAGPGPSA